LGFSGVTLQDVGASQPQIRQRAEGIAEFYGPIFEELLELGCGRGAAKSAESFERLRISGDVVRKEFQRHKTAERSVLSLVNNAHPAAEFLDNAVMRDDLANKRIRAGHVAHILGGAEPQVNEARLFMRRLRCERLIENCSEEELCPDDKKLFIPQRNHGVDAHGAAGWDVAGGEGDGGENDNHCGEGDGIRGADAVDELRH
jgi:hypothetical protein